MKMTLTIVGALIGGIALPAAVFAGPLECVRPVISVKTGAVLYCTRDLSLDWSDLDCSCRQIAAVGGGGGGWVPPVDEPPVDEPPVDEPPVDEPPVDEPPVDEPPVDEPPVVKPPKGPKPPKGGKNPGNDKPVGGAPFDGEQGEEPSGK
jgi:hypothetical protein